MNKYKCLNPKCNHIWSSEDEPFECPSCHNSEFDRIGGSGFSSFAKRWWWIGAVLIILIFIMSLCSGGSSTTVTVKPDYSLRRLTVNIKGQSKDDYKIILRKDGIIFGEKSKKEKAQFTDLEGTYVLDIQYIGSGKLPKLKPFLHVFNFTKQPQAPVPPQITNIEQNPFKLTKSIKTYTIIIITDTTTLPVNDTEFSSDGINWNKSNVFRNIKAGTSTFYVRHARASSLTDSKQITLDPFVPTPPPSISELSSLLKEIASGNQDALDKFKHILGNHMKVNGVNLIKDVQSLSNDAFINGTNYKVTKIEADSNGDISSITVL